MNNEIADMEKFHPRAVKLLRKRKPFLVVAEDEPYYMPVYALIRAEERRNGKWTTTDEILYQRAMARSS